MTHGYFNEQSARRIAREVRKSERAQQSDGREPPTNARPRAAPVMPFQLTGAFSATASTLGSTEKAAPARFVQLNGNAYEPTTAMPSQRLYDPCRIASGGSGDGRWAAWRGRWELMGGSEGGLSGVMSRSVSVSYKSSVSSTFDGSGVAELAKDRTGQMWIHCRYQSPTAGDAAANHLLPTTPNSTWGSPTARVTASGLYVVGTLLPIKRDYHTSWPSAYSTHATSSAGSTPHTHNYVRYSPNANQYELFFMQRPSTAVSSTAWVNSTVELDNIVVAIIGSSNIEDGILYENYRTSLVELTSGTEVGFMAENTVDCLGSTARGMFVAKTSAYTLMSYLGPISKTTGST